MKTKRESNSHGGKGDNTLWLSKEELDKHLNNLWEDIKQQSWIKPNYVDELFDKLWWLNIITSLTLSILFAYIICAD